MLRLVTRLSRKAPRVPYQKDLCNNRLLPSPPLAVEDSSALNT